jgi:non-ribosomal peptide synthetase component F
MLDLPTDRPRPPMQTFRGALHYFAVAPTIEITLKTLARQETATLFMLLLAAFKVLLYRWSGQPDQVIGTLIANRNRVEIEGLIGLFVNTVALRTDLSGNPGFRELLRRVRGTTLEGFAHQDLPFEKLVAELHPERRLSHHPLFQVLFALQNIPRPAPAGGLPAPDAAPAGWRTAKFDVAMFMAEAGPGVIGAFEYNTDLFDGSTIAAMAAHFEALLAGIAVNPDTSILDLPLGGNNPGDPADGDQQQGDFFADKFDFEQA